MLNNAYMSVNFVTVASDSRLSHVWHQTFACASAPGNTLWWNANQNANIFPQKVAFGYAICHFVQASMYEHAWKK